MRFQGSDHSVLVPEHSTLNFAADGTLSARIDCNRGRATWTSASPGELTLGAQATTRALCPRGCLYDQILRNRDCVRSYLLKGGHLFAALMADGGTYEYRPLKPPASDGTGRPPP